MGTQVRQMRIIRKALRIIRMPRRDVHIQPSGFLLPQPPQQLFRFFLHVDQRDPLCLCQPFHGPGILAVCM